MRFEELPNWLEIELQARDWVFQLKVVENLRMKYSNSSNFLSRKNDICTSLREKLGVFIVGMRLQMEVFIQAGSNLSHHLTQAPVDHLK